MTQLQPTVLVQANGRQFRINNVRLSFPSLWEPKGFNDEPTAQKKYHATVLIPKTATEVIKTVGEQVTACAKENFGAKAEQALAKMRAQPNYHILKDGDLKADRDGYAGMVYLHAANARKPTIFSQSRVQLTEDDGSIQAGDYVNIIIQLYTSRKYGIVGASFIGIQKAMTGDRFAASAANADDFEDVQTEETGTDGSTFF